MPVSSLRVLCRPSGADRFFRFTSGLRHWLKYAAPPELFDVAAGQLTVVVLPSENMVR